MVIVLLPSLHPWDYLTTVCQNSVSLLFSHEPLPVPELIKNSFILFESLFLDLVFLSVAAESPKMNQWIYVLPHCLPSFLPFVLRLEPCALQSSQALYHVTASPTWKHRLLLNIRPSPSAFLWVPMLMCVSRCLHWMSSLIVFHLICWDNVFHWAWKRKFSR